jgi:hypothetical protein
MARLGYQRYGAVGNDAGSMISPELGRIDPDHVAGVHVTQLFSFPSGDPAEMKDLAPEEQSQLQTLQWFYENKFSFNTLLSQQPQTIGTRSTTRRSGFSRGTPSCSARISTKDFALTNVMTYWLTRTGSSAGRLYYENARAPRPTAPTTLPLGLAGFGGDFLRASPLRATRPREHRALEDVRPRRPLRGPQGSRAVRPRCAGILSFDRPLNATVLVSTGRLFFAIALLGLGSSTFVFQEFHNGPSARLAERGGWQGAVGGCLWHLCHPCGRCHRCAPVGTSGHAVPRAPGFRVGTASTSPDRRRAMLSLEEAGRGRARR